MAPSPVLMKISARRRPFSGVAFLAWCALCFGAALLAAWEIRGDETSALFALLPFVAALAWLLTLPLSLMARRFPEWLAGGPLAMVCAGVLCLVVFPGY